MSVFDRLVVRGRAVFKMNAAAETGTVGVPDGTLRLYTDGTRQYIQTFSRATASTGSWETFNPAVLLAPADADYLVGTSNAGLASAIAAGATPGGELGGTWAAPSVDATHAGSAHHTRQHSMGQNLDHTATAWRMFYSDATGDVDQLALGAAGTVLTSNGASSIPTFAAVSAGPTRVYKLSDETVTSSTALQNDNELIIPSSVAVANATIAVRLVCFYRANTTPDIKFGWSLPSGTAFEFTANHHGSGGVHGNSFWDSVSATTLAAPGITSPAIVGVLQAVGQLRLGGTGGA